jgi:hypothetical protein
MATAIEKTLNRIGNAIGDAIQTLFNGNDEPTVSNTNANTGQTCLEATGMRQRELHLRQNTWRRNDIEYSKPLIDAEYNIQTEFKVSTTDETIQEKRENIGSSKKLRSRNVNPDGLSKKPKNNK